VQTLTRFFFFGDEPIKEEEKKEEKELLGCHPQLISSSYKYYSITLKCKGTFK
jgi:hypothetical protein